MTPVPEVRGIRLGGSVQDFRLTSAQRRRLRAARKGVEDAGVLKRIVALLDLDQGAPPVEVAARIGVTRQTLYNWVQRFGAGGGLCALSDRPRSGRPPKLSEPLRRVLVWLLKQPPDAFGYAAVGWTASLLREVLATWTGVLVSDDTLRRALHQHDHAWKRPRYVLRPDPDREKKTQDSPADRVVA
jgi:transposase